MSTQGQILANSTFGSLLEKLIMMNLPKTIVEIGTWKGMGSTKRIVDAIIKSNYKELPRFISLETNPQFHTIAENNLNKFLSYVELIHGRIVDIENVTNYISGLTLSPKHQKFFNDDLVNYSECENVLHRLPEKIDFLLLDGGEFSSYLEWELLKDRSRIIALDDTKMLKNKKAVEGALSDNQFELIFSSDERHGFHIFLNKTIL